METSQTYYTCPYNKTHVMKFHRLHHHLIDCRKANLHMNFKICPFNALHHYPEHMESQHFANCADRITLVDNNYLTYHDEKRIVGNVTIPPPVSISMEGENWDE